MPTVPKKLMAQQQGVTLLELILALTIIFLIIMMVGRYYESARSAQRVNEGVQLTQMITNAAEDWFSTYKTFAGISIETLRARNLLPDTFDGEQPNPWGGKIEVGPAKDDNDKEISGKLSITFYGVDSKDCINFCTALQSLKVRPPDSPDCEQVCQDSETDSSIDYTGIYP